MRRKGTEWKENGKKRDREEGEWEEKAQKKRIIRKKKKNNVKRLYKKKKSDLKVQKKSSECLEYYVLNYKVF